MGACALNNVAIAISGMDSRALAPAVASAIQQALSEHKSGDMLVFLPGMREMRAVQQTLDARRVGSNAMVSLLHGDLSMADQDALLAPAPQGAPPHSLLSMFDCEPLCADAFVSMRKRKRLCVCMRVCR